MEFLKFEFRKRERGEEMKCDVVTMGTCVTQAEADVRSSLRAADPSLRPRGVFLCTGMSVSERIHI